MTTKNVYAVIFWVGFGLVWWQTNWIVAVGCLLLAVSIVTYNK